MPAVSTRIAAGARSSDSLVANEALDRYGDSWFHLGDKDLALSLKRSALLRDGRRLSEVARYLGEAWDVQAAILPVSDEPVRTACAHASRVAQRSRTSRSGSGGRAAVLEVVYAGAGEASPAPGVMEAIELADLLVIAPSNPISSIGPILAVPGVREAIARRQRPNVAVSPVVNGADPTTDAERNRVALRRSMMEATGREHRPAGVAELYRDVIDGFVVDRRDEPTEAPDLVRVGLPILAADLLAPHGERRRALAAEVVRFGAALPLIHGQDRMQQ